MTDGKGSEAMIGYGPESKVSLNFDGPDCKPGDIHVVKKGELAPNPMNPSKGAHVNLLWMAMSDVAKARLSPEAGFAVLELSRRIEEIQNS